MRGDWNVRAQLDHRRAIASSPEGDWTEEAFRESGTSDARVVQQILIGEEPSNWRALEYGCGVGRLMEPLAACFAEIDGVDISDEMVRIGRQRLASLPNVRFHVLEGGRLPFPSGNFDLVYSFAVFQHMPKAAVRAMLPEITRVLKSDGTFLLHLNHPYTFRRKLQAWTGRDRPLHDTYRRRFYTVRQIRRLLAENALELRQFQRLGKGGRQAWYLAKRRSSGSQPR
jgi:SAM-dependent methyltransferase